MQDINYDEVLKGNVITITLGGEKYEVQEPTMGKILGFQRETEKLKGVSDVVKASSQIKKIILTVYTNIPEKALNGYSPKALYRILGDITKIVKESMLPEAIDDTDKNLPKKKLTKQS